MAIATLLVDLRHQVLAKLGAIGADSFLADASGRRAEGLVVVADVQRIGGQPDVIENSAAGVRSERAGNE